MTETLNITLISTFRAQLAGREPVLRQSAAKRLMALLALHGDKPMQRTKLAALFWENQSEAQARQNLRQLLYETRAGLANWTGLRIDRKNVGFAHGAVTTDIETILIALKSGEVPDILLKTTGITDQIAPDFDRAGDLLSSTVSVARRDIGNQIRSGLEQIMHGNDLRQSERAAQALLNIDPVDEVAVRTLLRLFSQAGNIGRALKVYEALWQALDDEYGMEPSQPTLDLIAKIKAGEMAAPAVAARAPSGKAIPIDVLPIETAANSTDLEWFGKAFRDTVLNSLVRFRTFQINDCSRASSGAAYQLSLRFFQRDARVDLFVSLRHTRTDSLFWSDHFPDLQKIWWQSQADVAGGISVACAQTLSQRHLASIADHAGQGSALDEWLLGQQHLFQFRPDRFPRAQVHFQNAIAHDPRYSRGYSSLSQLLNSQHMSCPGVLPDADQLARSKHYANKATALDPLDSLAQLCRAWAHCLLSEYDQALSGFDLALSANPNDTWTEISVALGKAFCGELTDARALATKSEAKIWARTPVYWTYHCTISYLLGDYAEASRAARNAEDVIVNTHGWHAAALWHMGDHDGAVAAWDELAKRVSKIWTGPAPDQPAICHWFANGFPIRCKDSRAELARTIQAVSDAYQAH